MATIGNYAGALGGMAKDAAKGAGNAFVGGLKGAVLREMPGVTAGMAFGKELSKRANAPKMQPGGAPPTNQQASTSSAMGGFGASVSLVAGQNKSNVINIEQVRQLKQLNDAVANQSKLIAFQIADQKRKDQFAEESANEQAFRDDELLKAIKNIGSRDSSGKKSSDDSKGGSSSFLGKLGDLISDNIGTILGGYLGYKGARAAGRALGGLGGGRAAGSVAGRAVPQIAGRAAAGAVIDVQAKVISSTVARGALVEGVATIVPMVLRFLTGPIGMGIMAAAGIGAYLYSKRDPEKAAGASANAALKKLDKAPPASSGQHSKAELKQDEAKALLEDRVRKEEVAAKAEAEADRISKSATATAQQIETAKKFAEGRRKAVDYDINAMGGLNRVQTIAGGKKDPGAPVTMDKYLKNLARTESANKANPDGDPNATSKTSTAAGLYQFLGDPKDAAGNPIKNPDGTIKVGTWKGVVNRMVREGVLSKEDAETNYLDDKFRFDPAKATKVAAFFTEKNRVGLKSALGRDPTETDLYMAHFLGLGDNKSGAISYLKLMDQNPNALGETIAGKGPAAANANIFYEGGDIKKPRTISQIYAMMGQRLTGNKSGIPAQTVEPPTGKEKTPTAPAGQKPKDPRETAKIDNSEADNYYKSLGVSGTGKGSTSNIGIDLVANKIADRMDAEAGANTMGTGGVKPRGVGDKISDALRGLSAEQIAAMIPDFSRRYPGIQLAAGPGFNLGGGGGGTKIEDDKPVLVLDEQAAKDRKADAKSRGLNLANGTKLPTKEANDATARQTKALKPLFRNNSEIIAETNKAFLQQFRSTATGIFTQAITKGLFPKGFGVSAGEAGRDDNYRGQQLQKIFGTDKVINDTTTKLLGKQYGPMFAPLFNNLAQGYLEVGSRVAGSAIFQGIGKLGAQETQTITGQVLGNFAAGNKKLALEQLLYGASGGKESGIALGAETLFAKYGFKNPAEGIQYFSSVLGEKATQPFSKLMGADDRSKSIVWNPRGGKDGTGAHVYVDSGREATAADIKASGNYGAPVSQTTMIPDKYNNFVDPYGPGLGPLRNAGSAGSVPAYRQVLDPNTNKMVAPSKRQILNLSNEEYMRDKEGNDRKADIQIELMKQQADAQAKIGADALKAAGEREAKRLEVEEKYEKAADVRTEANAAAVNYQAEKGSSAIVIAVKEAGGIEEGGGSKPTGLEDPKKGDTVRKSGQLFGGTADGKGGVSPLTGMQEIGNFAFDMGKNMFGAELTKNIKNPYTQMIANFAIQKGLNYVTDKFLGPLFDTGASALMDTGSNFISEAISWLGFADGGPISGPGTGRSDSIPAMLSNGEFVVNAGATKKYRPLLDALNYTKYANGTPAATGSAKDMSKVLGTAETNSQLAMSNDTLSSIDNSLLSLSGAGGGSGTSVSGYGGTAFDIGLGSPYGGSVSSGGAVVRNGVARSRPTQQKPSTMDYVEAIGKQLLISKGIGMASTAMFGATPFALASNFASGVSTGFSYGANAFAGDTIVAAGTQSGVTVGSSIAEFFGIGGASTTAATTTAATTASAAATTEAVLIADTLGGSAAAAGGAGGLGAGLAAAAPYLLAAVAVFMIIDSYSGGGGSAPPPKEPKFHAAIYVAGNNNISAIAPILETTEYHAVPDVFKTVAYGLLKVAFNATKTSEKVTNTSAPYDWVYMKVQHDRVSMLWGKGAPNPATLIDDGASEVKRWPALEESTNLNAYASDILALVRDEFKKTAKTENLSKLDQTADALSGYSLSALSSGLVSDLKSGNYKLDTSIEKGIYADSVAESNRISQLIDTANKQKAYITAATADTYEENASGGQTLIPGSAGGKSMVYSLKDGKFIESTFPGALLIDTAGRPVYDIEGTSAGLSVEDFVSASVAGANRSANILQPPPATTGAGGAGATNNTVVEGAKIDNSSVTTFVNSLTTVTDVVRSTTNQVGVTG